jgi:hypothetical protein
MAASHSWATALYAGHAGPHHQPSAAPPALIIYGYTELTY